MTTFQTPEPIDLTIEIQVAGTVHVIAGDRKDTIVVINPSDRDSREDVEAANRAQMDMTGDRLWVKVPTTSGIASYIGIGIGRSGSVDVTVELPENSSVDISTGFGDVRLIGQLGEARVKSGAGDVHADETSAATLSSGAGNLSLVEARGAVSMTAPGEIRLGRVDGDADIKNLNGKTWVGEVTGHLQVKASNGDISVERARSDVEAKTANGNVLIGEVSRGSISLKTGYGGLEVGVGEETAAWVDARTKFGRVHNEMESGGQPQSTERSVEIQARTAFGDVTVRRAATPQTQGEK